MLTPWTYFCWRWKFASCALCLVPAYFCYYHYYWLELVHQLYLISYDICIIEEGISHFGSTFTHKCANHWPPPSKFWSQTMLSNPLIGLYVCHRFRIDKQFGTSIINERLSFIDWLKLSKSITKQPCVCVHVWVACIVCHVISVQNGRQTNITKHPHQPQMIHNAHTFGASKTNNKQSMFVRNFVGSKYMLGLPQIIRSIDRVLKMRRCYSFIVINVGGSVIGFQHIEFVDLLLFTFNVSLAEV